MDACVIKCLKLVLGHLAAGEFQYEIHAFDKFLCLSFFM
jgi:hypothetical protein